jgi:hypothetical protein
VIAPTGTSRPKERRPRSDRGLLLNPCSSSMTHFSARLTHLYPAGGYTLPAQFSHGVRETYQRRRGTTCPPINLGGQRVPLPNCPRIDDRHSGVWQGHPDRPSARHAPREAGRR